MLTTTVSELTDVEGSHGRPVVRHWVVDLALSAAVLAIPAADAADFAVQGTDTWRHKRETVKHVPAPRVESGCKLN